MKVNRHLRKADAITLLEVLVVVVVVVILAGLVVPWLSRAKIKSERISCVSNLKNVGLAFRIFTTDHGGEFPWRVSGTNGTKDLLADPNAVWRHFLAISNELSVPEILKCPADRERDPAAGFANFGPANLSYFLGLEADENEPRSILGGDRNLTTNGVDVGPGLLLLRTSQIVGFSETIHRGEGNIVLGDGSVQQADRHLLQVSFRDAAAASTNAINRLLIP